MTPKYLVSYGSIHSIAPKNNGLRDCCCADLPRSLLARFFHILHGQATRQISWNAVAPLEWPRPVSHLNDGGIMVETGLTLNNDSNEGDGTTNRGSFQSIWTLCPLTGLLKMCRFEMTLRANESRPSTESRRSDAEICPGNQLEVRMEINAESDQSPVPPLAETLYLESKEASKDSPTGTSLDNPEKTDKLAETPERPGLGCDRENISCRKTDPSVAPSQAGTIVATQVDSIDDFGLHSDALRFLDVSFETC